MDISHQLLADLISVDAGGHNEESIKLQIPYI